MVEDLKEFQKHKDDIIKSTNKYAKGLTEEGKIKIKKNVGPTLSKLSKITKKKPVENKAKGGRVGLKSGNGFPDLSGDGKTTFKDILIGRGVIKKGKKKTMMAKKSETPMDKAVKKDKKSKKEDYIMAKLCPRGKAKKQKAKIQKFINLHTRNVKSAVCSG